MLMPDLYNISNVKLVAVVLFAAMVAHNANFISFVFCAAPTPRCEVYLSHVAIGFCFQIALTDAM